MLTPVNIPRISPPDIKDFYRLYVGASTPVVITGLADNWPAMKFWNLDYFSSNYGSLKTGVTRLVAGECDFNISRGSKLDNITLQESVASIAQGRIDEGWAIASPAEIFPEKLQNDYFAPKYCANGKFLRSRIFIGPAGTVTSLHQDLPENLYVMVKGCKRITLFKPSAASQVYPNSRFSKLPNHAQTDPEKPDYLRFPKLQKAQPYVVDLKGGETLFIPSFWWHHLRNLESSIAVNFWWSYGWKLPIAWAAATYKKMREI